VLGAGCKLQGEGYMYEKLTKDLVTKRLRD